MAGAPHTAALLPASARLSIGDTQSAGRAAFCDENLLNGASLLTTSSSISPISYVVLRVYWKEVCSECFAYDRGRTWRLRDVSIACAFCSEACQEHWTQRNDEICRKAIQAVEAFNKTRTNRYYGGADADYLHSIIAHPNDSNFVSKFWQEIQTQGTEILASRRSSRPSKLQQGTVRKTLQLLPDVDILTYVLSGILAAYRCALTNGETSNLSPETLLPALFELASDDQVFIHNPMTPSPLQDYASSYLVLLALLPAEMLDVLSAHLIVNLASRASHNAFSIRPEGLTDGNQSGEFLGWGVWPEASYFNHSCRPNVRKQRIGRLWHFSVDILQEEILQKGSQLCITYLGGDEEDLDVYGRRQRLQEQWGFHCMCERCMHESTQLSSNT